MLLFTDSRPGLQALPEVKERWSRLWVRKVSELVVKMSADCHETASSDLLPECFLEFMHNVFSGAKQALNNSYIQILFLMARKVMEISVVNINVFY